MYTIIIANFKNVKKKEKILQNFKKIYSAFFV